MIASFGSHAWHLLFLLVLCPRQGSRPCQDAATSSTKQSLFVVEANCKVLPCSADKLVYSIRLQILRKTDLESDWRRLETLFPSSSARSPGHALMLREARSADPFHSLARADCCQSNTNELSPGKWGFNAWHTCYKRTVFQLEACSRHNARQSATRGWPRQCA